MADRDREPWVLVLTAPVDPTADVVIQHLNDAGIPLARFDAAQFPTAIGLTATLDGERGWQTELGRHRSDCTSVGLLPTTPAVRVRCHHCR